MQVDDVSPRSDEEVIREAARGLALLNASGAGEKWRGEVRPGDRKRQIKGGMLG